MLRTTSSRILSAAVLVAGCSNALAQFAGQIVYAAQTPTWPRGTLFIMNLADRSVREIPHPPVEDVVTNPQFSRDGRWICFNGGPSSSSQVFLIRPDGSGFFQVTTGGGDHVLPSFSPDGQQIVFNNVYADMFIINRDGTGLIDLGFYGAHCRWSPCGTRISYSNWPFPDLHSDVFLYDLVTRSNTQLTHHTNDSEEGAVNVSNWSPECLRLAVTKSLCDEGGCSDIWTLNIDGTNLTNLTADMPSTTESNACWSPKGDFIVFLSNVSGNFDIWCMRADGSEKQNLTNTPDIDEEAPCCGPIESLCPADFDANGFITGDDFDAFVEAFQAGC